MWYFSWAMGLGFALCFGVLNAIWYDLADDQREKDAVGRDAPEGSPQARR